MRKFIFCVAISAFILVLASSLSAQMVQRTYEKVTPAGAETVTENFDVSLATTGLFSPMYTLPGIAWHYPNPSGLLWISNAVAVGNRGTQVIVGEDLNYERAQLFSVFDSNPPTPIWEDLSMSSPKGVIYADSSQTGDYHLVCYTSDAVVTGYQFAVNMYRSDSSVPAWTWTPPNADFIGPKIAIDRAPSIVAIGTFDDLNKDIIIYFLDPDTGAQIDSYAQAATYYARGFDLSADGSTLYFYESGGSAYIYDINAGSVTFSTPLSASFDSHAISGDGTKFAYGQFYNVYIWEKSGSSWSSWSKSTGSGTYGSYMDFSDDGSTLVCGVTQFSPDYNKPKALVIDIASQTIVDEEVFVGSGGYQDVISGAAISHDGKYAVVSRWGDQNHSNPEVTIIKKGAGIIGTIDSPGSAFDVDMSWDGQVTVSGHKAIHANVSGNGGDVYYYDLGGEDMDMIGPPIVGQSVLLEVYTDPNWYFALLLGTADVPTGFATFPFGTLYLDTTFPNLFIMFPVLQADGTGLGTLNLNIPNNPILIGATVFFQSLVSPNGSSIQLTADYLTMTGLP
jgi:hypothetical protein